MYQNMHRLGIERGSSIFFGRRHHTHHVIRNVRSSANKNSHGMREVSNADRGATWTSPAEQASRYSLRAARTGSKPGVRKETAAGNACTFLMWGFLLANLPQLPTRRIWCLMDPIVLSAELSPPTSTTCFLNSLTHGFDNCACLWSIRAVDLSIVAFILLQAGVNSFWL